MKVICISGKAESGKDLTASVMKEKLEKLSKKVLVTHYGDLVKYICTTYFGWNGQKDEQGRQLLQYVGTEKFRNEWSSDFWVDFIVSILYLFEDKWDYVLIPDCRFPNEIKRLREYGFDTVSVKIERENFKSKLTVEQLKHSSEVSMDDFKFDYTIHNRNLTELYASIGEFISSEVVNA